MLTAWREYLYARACARFFAWCDGRGLTLITIRPFDVATYMETLQQTHSAPGVKQQLFALEAAIDKALLSAFGHGTSAYMRYNRAAALDHGPLITNVPVRSTVLPPASGEPGSQDDPREAQEARAYFSEGRERSIDLLQKAICTLEDEIEELNPVVAAPQKSNATQPADDVQMPQTSRRSFVNAAWRRVARWWRGPNS
jgi:hypothetical protein